MENATKALLIAAAVLIVILLIAFGMRIFNSTGNVSGQATDTGKAIEDTTETSAMDLSELLEESNEKLNGTDTEVKKFNRQITKYCTDGAKISTERVKTLIKKCSESNATLPGSRQITAFMDTDGDGQAVDNQDQSGIPGEQPQQNMEVSEDE